ncbi:MAG: GIY-YIG nuclease family protein [Balneola sp.]
MLSNISKMIYIGIINNLERGVFEYKSKQRDGFTKKYNLHQLVYYEETDDIGRAIEREKQLKGWTRQKKVALIESINPTWKDLSKDWYS